jgi:inosine-uridine nucleoside N-ribohydrolase
VADWWQATEAQPNCHVAYAVDDVAFFSQLTQKLSTLP